MSSKIRVCCNQQCGARHSFRDWHSGTLVIHKIQLTKNNCKYHACVCIGVFNISNKILIALDLLLGMRQHISMGEPPGNTAEALVMALLSAT